MGIIPENEYIQNVLGKKTRFGKIFGLKMHVNARNEAGFYDHKKLLLKLLHMRPLDGAAVWLLSKRSKDQKIRNV